MVIRAHRWRWCAAGFLVGLMAVFAMPGGLSASEPKPLKVVATIRPLHGLVAGVMAGVGTPSLLVDGYQSPHHFTLTPSAARRLEHADVVVLIGDLMPALANAIGSLSAHAYIVDLSRAPGLRRLPVRDHHGVGANHVTHDHDIASRAGALDPHTWLDPINAKAMVSAISEALGKRDPEHAATYSSAAAEMAARLDRLTDEITSALRPHRDRKFMVSHDSFQYFEARFSLTGLGAIAPGPETRPGAAHLRRVEKQLAAATRPCLLTEPGAQPELTAMLAHKSGARTIEIDPLGRAVSAGPDHYFAMMRSIATAMTVCFSTP